MATKTRKGTGRILWFNAAKGYGSVEDDDGTRIFIYGQIFGGDEYGLNIPKNRMIKDDDRVEYVAQLSPRPIFPSNPELRWSAIECKKLCP